MIVKNLMKGAFAAGILFSSASAFGQDQGQQQMQQQQQMQDQQMQQQQQHQPMQPPMHRKPPQERAQKQIEWMQKNLMISDDQKARIFPVLVKTYHEEDRASANMPPGAEKQQEKKEIKHDEYAELRNILDPDQFQKFMAHVKEMKEMKQDRRAQMQQEGR